jgi:hypothetical protein
MIYGTYANDFTLDGTAAMALRELSKKEYRSAFCDPMRRLGEKESYRPVPLKSEAGIWAR